MGQIIQISQTKFDQLLNRISRLETTVEKLLAGRKTDLPMVDEETEKMIATGLEDYKNGRYTKIKTKKELETYLKSL